MFLLTYGAISHIFEKIPRDAPDQKSEICAENQKSEICEGN
jgi:hypothetical protein